MSVQEEATVGKSKWKKRTVGLLAAVGLAIAVVPGTGALFSDTETGSVTITSGSLSASLSDDNSSAGLDLAFAVAPGVPQKQALYVMNNGTVPANIVMSAPPETVVITPASGSNPDLSMLMFGVENYAAYQPVVGSAAVNLGVIQPGQTIRYVLEVGLDAAADNQWQGASISATLQFVLTQQL